MADETQRINSTPYQSLCLCRLFKCWIQNAGRFVDDVPIWRVIVDPDVSSFSIAILKMWKNAKLSLSPRRLFTSRSFFSWHEHVLFCSIQNYFNFANLLYTTVCLLNSIDRLFQYATQYRRADRIYRYHYLKTFSSFVHKKLQLFGYIEIESFIQLRKLIENDSATSWQWPKVSEIASKWQEFV